MKLFRKEPDPKQVARDSKREIGRGARDIEREIASLKRDEAKLVQEIKAAAKQGNQAGTRILAQQLVRLRGQINRMQAHRAQLQGVSLSVTTAASTAAVGASMATAGKAMAAVGAAADPRKMQQDMMQFAKQNEMLSMAGEMMDGALDDVLDTEGLEEETEGVMAQVLDEIGIDLGGQLQSAPKQRLPAAKQPASAATAEDEQLSAMLAALK